MLKEELKSWGLDGSVSVALSLISLPEVNNWATFMVSDKKAN